MSDAFDAPHYAYGGMRLQIFEVIDRQDPEQAGRLKVRAVGYQDQGDIPEDQLPWARVTGATTNPQDGGRGGPLTGARKGSFLIGYPAKGGGQHPILIGSIGKAGTDANGAGQLNQSGKNHDLPKASRDKDKEGGDFRWDSKGAGEDDTGDYDSKDMLTYFRNESTTPDIYGRRGQCKEGSEDEGQAHSIGKFQYA